MGGAAVRVSDAASLSGRRIGGETSRVGALTAIGFRPLKSSTTTATLPITGTADEH